MNFVLRCTPHPRIASVIGRGFSIAVHRGQRRIAVYVVNTISNTIVLALLMELQLLTACVWQYLQRARRVWEENCLAAVKIMIIIIIKNTHWDREETGMPCSQSRNVFQSDIASLDVHYRTASPVKSWIKPVNVLPRLTGEHVSTTNAGPGVISAARQTEVGGWETENMPRWLCLGLAD